MVFAALLVGSPTQIWKCAKSTRCWTGSARRVILQFEIIYCGRPRTLVSTILHNACVEKGSPSIFKLEQSMGGMICSRSTSPPAQKPRPAPVPMTMRHSSEFSHCWKDGKDCRLVIALGESSVPEGVVPPTLDAED